MIRRERRRTADKFAAGVGVRSGDLGEFFKPGMFEKIPQVAEGILVWHEVNAEFAAARFELANFLPGQRAPAFPDELVMAIRERVLGVELKFVDFKIGKVLDQFKQ